MKIEVTFNQSVFIVGEQLEAAAKQLQKAADEIKNGRAKEGYKAVNFDLQKTALTNLETIVAETGA